MGRRGSLRAGQLVERYPTKVMYILLNFLSDTGALPQMLTCFNDFKAHLTSFENVDMVWTNSEEWRKSRGRPVQLMQLIRAGTTYF